MTDTRIKFCGLGKPADIAAAARAGAAYVGFVFFPKSPRNVDLETAAALAASVPAGICKVALTVDADDALLRRITDAVPLDMLQLHGSETPDRVAEAVRLTGARQVDLSSGVESAPGIKDPALIAAFAKALA